jgi:hypothetical protein
MNQIAFKIILFLFYFFEIVIGGKMSAKKGIFYFQNWKGTHSLA